MSQLGQVHSDAAMVNEAATDKEKNQYDQNMAKIIMSKAAALVRESNSLPRCGDDFELLNSYSLFTQFMEQQEYRICNIINKMMLNSGCSTKLPKNISDMDGYMERIVQADDRLIERVGVLMDILERAGRNEEVCVPKTIIGAESTRRENNMNVATAVKTFSENIGTALAARLRAVHEESFVNKATFTGPKPQKAYGFDSVIDNSRKPFVSKLNIKHNMKERKYLQGLTIIDDEERSMWHSDQALAEHPYQYEKDHFDIPERQLESHPPMDPIDVNTSNVTFVDTLDGLERLRDILNSSTEFAVDLEHHDHRSFMGLTCLLQISTRESDYIIDPFPLWMNMHILNEPFTNPKILKVFHGAERDIIWLQRDFGIYVINMFDTYRAMRRLDLPKFSLQFLVQKYCNVTLMKEFQMSDWRVRPLPSQLLDYARGDTHYLLYCHDKLREELLERGNELKNLLKAVYTESMETCGKVFTKPVFDPEGYRHFLSTRRSLNNRQFCALVELWKWRDQVAREEDESTNFVLPIHMMLHIAEALPREMQGIIACCSPVPLMVKERLLELHKIVYAARDQPLEQVYSIKKPVVENDRSILQNIIDEANRMTKVKSLIRCKMDFSHSRFDEEIGNIFSRVQLSDADDILEVEGTETFVNVIESDLKESDSMYNVVTNSLATNHSKLSSIISRLEAWATPFECYTIALKEAAKKEARLRDEQRRREELGTSDESKKMYSHHDEVVCRKPVIDNANVDQGDISLCDSAQSQFTDEILTKKALKRKKKHIKSNADISTNPAGSSTVKRLKTSIEGNNITNKEANDEISPVDYSKFDSNMFSQKMKSKEDFDPFHQTFRLENKKNKQKQGKGMHRMGTMSIGYKPVSQ